VAAVLEAHTTSHDAACECAAEIYEAYGAAFDTWFADHTMMHDPPEVIAAALAVVFDDVDLDNVTCHDVIDAEVRAAMESVLVEHFVAIVRQGYQFERFEDAWCAWADADATIDWTEEHLQDTVLEILGAGVTTPDVDHETLCTCAATIIAEFGTVFLTWMDTNVAAGTPLDQFTEFVVDDLALCAGLTFAGGTEEAIRARLRERYATYTEVSYRLHVLVLALADLRNTYPRATLHDCDEGSDFNPVRLGQTALGSN
jgi:hypothetical protein